MTGSDILCSAVVEQWSLQCWKTACITQRYIISIILTLVQALVQRNLKRLSAVVEKSILTHLIHPESRTCDANAFQNIACCWGASQMNWLGYVRVVGFDYRHYNIPPRTLIVFWTSCKFYWILFFNLFSVIYMSTNPYLPSFSHSCHFNKG